MKKLYQYLIVLSATAALLLTLPLLSKANDYTATKDLSTASKSTSSVHKSTQSTQVALFAGGCFWCMEKPFEHLDGVVSVISGYATGPLCQGSCRLLKKSLTD